MLSNIVATAYIFLPQSVPLPPSVYSQLLLRPTPCLLVFETSLQCFKVCGFLLIYLALYPLFPSKCTQTYVRLSYSVLSITSFSLFSHLLLFLCFLLNNFFSSISRLVIQLWAVSNLLFDQSFQFLSLTIIHNLIKLLTFVCSFTYFGFYQCFVYFWM